MSTNHAVAPADESAFNSRRRRPARPVATPIRTYTEAVTDGPSIVGGKGWNLGRLARYGFQVPLGGVLSAETYRRHLAAANVTEPRAALLGVPAIEADLPETVAQLDLIRAAVEGTP